MPGSREGRLEESPGLHVRRMRFSSPKAPVLILHEKHGIVLPPLELMHRHDADAGCFPVIVDELVLEYRFVQQFVGRRVPAFPVRAEPRQHCEAVASCSDCTFGCRESMSTNGSRNTTLALHPGRQPQPDRTYEGFQSPAAGPASGRVSPESHDAIVTISAWS